MRRQDVFTLVDDERAYQDEGYNGEIILASGLTRKERDLDPAAGILMLEEYAARARAAWVGNRGDSVPALRQVAKIAAIAVRILERAGEADKLLEVGLR